MTTATVATCAPWCARSDEHAAEAADVEGAYLCRSAVTSDGHLLAMVTVADGTVSEPVNVVTPNLSSLTLEEAERFAHELLALVATARAAQ